ncbi:Xylosyltransferase oxt [Halotydeus destructor]|nr:Xylosyltransferase oxt [Halotydeus destructor]
MVFLRLFNSRRIFFSRRYGALFILVFTILAVQLILSLFVYNESLDDSETTNSLFPHESSTREKNEVSNTESRQSNAHQRTSHDDEDTEISSSKLTHRFLSSKTSTGKERHPAKLGDSKLNLDELDFQPSCQTITKEALSALNRATTQKCKEEIVKISCLSQQGKLFPKNIPRNCPNHEKYGHRVGCYRDKSKPRLLSNYATKLNQSGPLDCVNVCLQYGYPYAGVEYANQCFCGNKLPDRSAKLSDSDCDMSCPVRSNASIDSNPELCGGFFAIDIYETGLSPRKKLVASQEDDAKGQDTVKIAFVFTVNGRAFRQLKRLIKNVYSPRHIYLFHVDKRQDYLHRELKNLEMKFSNIHVMPQRLPTIWGGASLLKILLSAMKHLVRIENNDWDYFINLSESDFPIKSLERLELFLTANKGKNFVKSHGQETHKFISKQGLDKIFLECESRMWRLGDRRLPFGIRWDGGSDWVALHRDFCTYLQNDNNSLISGLSVVYDYTLLPAESYFHTVLQNSEFCDTVIDNNLHITNWRRKLGCKCQYKHIVDWCGCSPNDFKDDDWNRILIADDKQYYFGRKFEAVVNQAIINRLERHISHTSSDVDSSYDKYWESIYDHQDQYRPESDDRLSFLSIMSIISAKKVTYQCSNLDSGAGVEPSLEQLTISNSHVMLEDNELRGLLLMYSVTLQERTHVFEALVQVHDDFEVHRLVGPTSRLITMKVCSNYDQKEQMSRNFGCIMAPFSEPTIIHKWMLGTQNFTVTFVWIDPANIVAGSFEVKIDKGDPESKWIIMHHKPTFNKPLRPGIWRVVLMYQWQTIAETRFPIIPFIAYNSKSPDEQQVTHLHRGPSLKYIEYNFSSIESLLGLQNSQTSQLRIANANAKRFGQDLSSWAQNIIAEFYSVKDICSVQEDHHCSQIQSCDETEWSSSYPDPKSAL